MNIQQKQTHCGSELGENSVQVKVVPPHKKSLAKHQVCIKTNILNKINIEVNI